MTKKLPQLPAIRDLIRVYGLSANQKFSQNFILDKNVTDSIAHHARISPRDDLVVEVGPGPGLLTRSILDAGAQRVIVVEKDKRFIPALQQLSEASDQRLDFIIGDMLKLDHSDIFTAARNLSLSSSSPIISSASSEPSIPVTTTITTDSSSSGQPLNPLDETNSTIRLLGNLPFGVASPMLIQWLKMMALRQGIFQSKNRVTMTLMFQKEVAEGIVAPPGFPDRSRLSIMAQSICDVKLAYQVPSGVFVPKPKVDAAVVHFEPKQNPLVSGSLDKVEDIARYFFNKRRKTMGNNTNRMIKKMPEMKPILHEWIEEGAWDMNQRPEEVSTEQFCALARKLDRAQIKIPLT